MNIKVAFIVIAFLASCSSSKVTPISGTYQKPPFVITSTSNFNAVWDKLIDIFAQKGLPIKIIDRSSGLIVSDRALLSSTFELKTGGLKDPSAFIVLPKVYLPSSKKTTNVALDLPVTGEWNVRIKEASGGSTINVNIVNVRYETYDFATKRTGERIATSYQSTGVFERIIADAIK